MKPSCATMECPGQKKKTSQVENVYDMSFGGYARYCTCIVLKPKFKSLRYIQGLVSTQPKPRRQVDRPQRRQP